MITVISNQLIRLKKHVYIHNYAYQEAAACESLDYSTAKEGEGPAKAWIEANTLGDFVNNKMVAGNGPPLSLENSATNSTLCTIATNGGTNLLLKTVPKSQYDLNCTLKLDFCH